MVLKMVFHRSYIQVISISGFIGLFTRTVQKQITKIDLKSAVLVLEVIPHMKGLKTNQGFQVCFPYLIWPCLNYVILIDFCLDALKNNNVQ